MRSGFGSATVWPKLTWHVEAPVVVLPPVELCVEGAVVLSLRGGDFILDSGQDLSIGYLDHDADVVRLYLEESFSFRVLEPDAAVAVQTKA